MAAAAVSGHIEKPQVEISPIHGIRITLTSRNVRSLESSKTRNRFQLHVHKRVIDLHTPSETVKLITSTNIEPGVEVEVTIADA